uniref:SP-RING-type domain-containing protein n=1 Tax=Trichuris muris TaxID=70415 RepID=A0A5S6PZR5_TRIMR
MQHGSVCSNVIGNKMNPKPAMMAAAPQYDDLMWTRNGSPHGSVSVFTTVYSAMPPNYSGNGPQLSYSTSALPGAQTANQAYNAGMSNDLVNQVTAAKGPGNAAVTPCYAGDVGPPNTNANPYGTTDYTRPGNYHTGDPSNSEYASANGNPTAALNAAHVAAAAVATATATATAVAIDQTQFQPYPPQQQVPVYGSQQYSAAAAGQPSSFNLQGRMVQPNMVSRPQMPPAAAYMSNVRQQATVAVGQGQTASMARYASVAQSQFVGNRQQVAQMVATQSSQYAGPMSPVVGMTPNGGPMLHQQQPIDPAATGLAPYPGSAVQSAPMMNGPYQKYPTSQMARNAPVYFAGGGQVTMAGKGMCNNYMNATFNAQQPVSPGYQMPQSRQVHVPNQVSSSNPPYMAGPYQGSPGAAPGGSYVDVKPVIQPNDDVEPRMSFPVKDGMILQPFRLEHNIPVSQITFFVMPEQFNLLCSDPDLDIQLKCFHADDRFMCNNWPHNASIQIVVNGTPVIVRQIDRPLYIKNLCQPNKNTLQVAVQQCCCSHLFMLSLISRPHVERVLSNLVRRKLLPVELAIEKIKRSFMPAEVAASQISDVEHLSTTISLKCPFTMTKMSLPARCNDCRHIQCFDLKTFLVVNKDRLHWQCPICARPTTVENLEIDQYVWGILTNLAKCPDVSDVLIDSSASWKAHCAMALKQEIPYVPCGTSKRFKSEAGIDPTVCTWSQGTTGHLRNAAGMQVPIERVSNVTGLPASDSVKISPPTAKKHHYTNQVDQSTVVMTVGSTTQSGTSGHSVGGAVAQSPYQAVSADCAPQQLLKYNPPTPVTPLPNPPSVGGGGSGPRSVGNPPSVEGAYAVQCSTQSNLQLNVDGSAAGSAPYTPASVGSAGSQQGSHSINVASNEMCNSEFNDLSFDAADLLPSDGASENIGNLFTDSTMPDPGEFIQYFENSNFGDFGLSMDHKAAMDGQYGDVKVATYSKGDGHNDSGAKLNHCDSSPSRKDSADSSKAAIAAISSNEMDDIMSLLQN